MNTRLIIGLTLLVLVIIFIIQNAVAVDIRFLIWKVSMSRSLVILIVLAIGIAIGWISASHVRKRK